MAVLNSSNFHAPPTARILICLRPVNMEIVVFSALLPLQPLFKMGFNMNVK